jgi:hypothetical protein
MTNPQTDEIERVARAMIRQPTKTAPAGCFCTDRCMAPRLFGRQLPCRRGGGVSAGAFPSCNVPRCDNPASADNLCRQHFGEHRDNGGAS